MLWTAQSPRDEERLRLTSSGTERALEEVSVGDVLACLSCLTWV